ncbi:hypothetical protein [Desulfoscipio gibsoniae]
MNNNHIINDNGVVITGHVGGSVINVSTDSIDWLGLAENLEVFLIECNDKELRRIASEMLKHVRAKKINKTKQSAKKIREKGLHLAKQLGLNILSGFIVYASTSNI